MTTWTDLNARARGLSTHLLGRARLEALLRCDDLADLGAQLAASGYPVSDKTGGFVPEALELAVRRHAAAQLAIVARWAGKRSATLAVIFEDEDRRSLRALVRGTGQAAPVATRLAGLIPTPLLPERALEELAACVKVKDLATQLVLWEHPYGHPLADEARRGQPDLFKLELVLTDTFASRATRAARRGGAELRRYTRSVLDVENAVTAVLLADGGGDVDVGECFVEGGDRLDRAAFVEAATAESRPASANRVADAFGVAPIGAIIRRFGAQPAMLERAVRGFTIEQLRHRARVAPLGPAPLLSFVLRLRAESVDLSRIIWSVTLGAPAAHVARDLVTRR